MIKTVRKFTGIVLLVGLAGVVVGLLLGTVSGDPLGGALLFGLMALTAAAVILGGVLLVGLFFNGIGWIMESEDD